MASTTSDKRINILRAAMKLIAVNGFHGSPTAMIAAEAGVGAGTLYRYFSDKDALIIEVHKEVEIRLYEQLQQDYPSKNPFATASIIIYRPHDLFH
jgi:AcrR family transcriptional regulator